MGSIITLGVGKLELDWGKNSLFANHSHLFLSTDVCKVPYFYADGIIEYQDGFSRKLRDVKRRLELLGYPLHALKSKYETHFASMPDYYPKQPLPFEDFYTIVTAIDPDKIALDEEGDECDLGEFVSKHLFKDPEFNKKFNLTGFDSWHGTTFENMDPYITLRILIENPANADLHLQWRYADVLEGGWTEMEVLSPSLSDSSKILIVTEGSSDSFVIRRAIELLFPDIADFFSFIDMQDNYPFTGTGNLYKFCQGLASIRIQNNVLIIFDNDTEGVRNYELAKNLNLPNNMKITKLPDHKSFASFLTVGPNGQSKTDINGLAVAIECFLDLSFKISKYPSVRWTSFDPKTKKYQGELINKDTYIREFKKIRSLRPDYDFSKLQYLIDHLYKEWLSTPASR